MATALAMHDGASMITQFQSVSIDDLVTVQGGAGKGSNPAVCLPGVKNDSSGRPEQSLTNPTAGAKEHEATKQGLENYGKFYERYTGLIENLNGIGGGGAVAGGAKPGPELGF